MQLKRIAVFASGGGSNFGALLEAIENKEVNAQVVLLLSNAPSAYACARAREKGIPVAVINKATHPEADARAQAILKALAEKQADYIVLAGYLPIVPAAIIRAYPNRIVNIHPSLIPAFCGKGFYGHFVHEAAVARGVKLSGATVHFVDEGTDTGPIICQESVPVFAEDSPEDLAARVLKVEHSILPRALSLICADRVLVKNNTVHILTKKEDGAL